MRCKQDEFLKERVFHFYNKTPEGKILFKCDKDYEYFLLKFKRNVSKYPCEIYAYCLMPNHFHFCLKQSSEIPIYKLFNDTLISYALYYNSKYQCKGKLLQGKLQHKRICKDEYLISLCQYIHSNPVKAGIVNKVSEWKYSNFPEYTAARNGKLFSKELIKMYHEVFENYNLFVSDYNKRMQDKVFYSMLLE